MGKNVNTATVTIRLPLWAIAWLEQRATQKGTTRHALLSSTTLASIRLAGGRDPEV